MTSPRPYRRRALIGAAAGTALGVAGGSAWALDRFVIDKVEVADASSRYDDTATSASSPDATPTAAEVGDSAYSGPSGSVQLTAHTSGTGSSALAWYVADVRLATGTALRSAFAQDTFGQSIVQTPSEMAAANGAVLAVNGDYYGFRSTGIVIRNGALFRDKPARQGLAVHRDGSMALYDETLTSGSALLADGVWQTASFGPGLVDDGVAVPGIDGLEIDTNVGNHSIQGLQPRTAIGMISAGHLVVVVVDGRTAGHSVGITLPDLADLMVDLGCQVAYNLDGGGSSTLWFNGAVVNEPSGRGNSERGTSDIYYLGR